jgi:quinol monooxygenase YgiN
MTSKSVTLINLLKVAPCNQAALVDLLKQNIDTVIRNLAGWHTSRLIAARDGASVIIYSVWDSPEAVEAMRADPRMRAYFPRILELASVESIVGEPVYSDEH